MQNLGVECILCIICRDTFNDFSKAFDTIPRDILLKKLLTYNIKGKFFNIIKDIYTSDNACIKISKQITEPFEINRGVRQRCVLSALICNICYQIFHNDTIQAWPTLYMASHVAYEDQVILLLNRLLY